MAENYFMGQDGFVWFIGCVESRNDPAELGRVQVRCLGYHTENKEDIPTADLPWAHVMHPTTDPSMQGMGTTPSFLVEGTWVVGFFRDAVEKQQPIIMGSLPGYNQDLANTTKGFNDPSGVYPSFSHAPSGHSIEESDINRLARNDATRQHGVISKKDAEYEAETNPSGRTTSVSQQGFTWEEPTSPYNALYPKNHVFESESGHIKEYDDTPGFERIHEYHKTGTFYEIDANGTRRTRVVGDDYQVILENNFVNVKGNVSLTIDNDCNTYIKGDWNVTVDGDKTEVIGGNLKQEIKNTSQIKVGSGDTSGDYSLSVKGNVTEKFGVDTTNTVTVDIAGTTTETVGLIKNVNVVGDSNEDSDTFEQAVNETYNQKLITKVTKAVEETFTGGQKTLITGTLDLDATTEVDIRSATINLNKGDVEEGGTVEEIEEPVPAQDTDSKTDLEEEGVEVDENSSTDKDAIQVEPSDERREVTTTPNIVEAPSAYKYFGDWNDFDNDTEKDKQLAAIFSEQNKSYIADTDKKKSSPYTQEKLEKRKTDFWGFKKEPTTTYAARSQHALNYHCDKETAEKILGNSVFVIEGKGREGAGKGMLSNTVFNDNDFDSATIAEPANSPYWIPAGNLGKFANTYNDTTMTRENHYELLGINPNTKQRTTREGAIKADLRIRSELKDILTSIAEEWSSLGKQFHPDTKGKQFVINSGYRDPLTNVNAESTAINHRTGKAIDISIRSAKGTRGKWSVDNIIQFIDLCLTKGIVNVGCAKTFLHLDINGASKNFRRAWKYGKDGPDYLNKDLKRVFIKHGVFLSGNENLYASSDSPIGEGWIAAGVVKKPEGELKVSSIGTYTVGSDGKGTFV